jgi:hypothetical protein
MPEETKTDTDKKPEANNVGLNDWLACAGRNYGQ